MQKVSRNAVNRPRMDVLVKALPVLETEEDYVAEITHLARQVDETYWRIGELLIEAKEKLQIGDEFWYEWVDSHLPFGRQTAFKIMKATELLKSGEIPNERLPPAYSLVYEIAVIPAEYRPLAAPSIRPEMSRNDIKALKQTIIPPKAPKPRTRRKVEAELRRVDEEMARLARRREELQREFDDLTR